MDNKFITSTDLKVNQEVTMYIKNNGDVIITAINSDTEKLVNKLRKEV